MKLRSLVAALLASTALWASPAAAELQLQITSPGQPTTTVGDGGDGTLNFSGAIGSWTVNTTDGFGSAVTGAPAINMVSFNVSSFPTGSSGSITLMLSESDLSVAALASLADFSAAISGNTQGTVEWSMYVSDANVLFDQSQLIGSASFGAGGDFASSFDGMRLVEDAFSMTLVSWCTKVL